MMDQFSTADFMMIALHFMTCTLLLCGILVWIERRDNPKQRTYLAVVLLIATAMMMLRVLFSYKGVIPDAYPVLPIPNLYGGFWALLILFFYPVEVVNPGWLRWRIVLFLLLPMIAISVILATVPMEFRQLNSWVDILTHFGEPNVWFRLIILFIFIIPYTILLLCVPYNWRQSSVDVKWIKIYVVGVLGIGILYILFMLTGSLLVSAIHLTYCMLFFCYITYQELHLRLFPSLVKQADELAMKQVPLVGYFNGRPKIDSSGVRERLEEYMREQEPWRSPNVTIEEVAKAIGCSRSTLSAIISTQWSDSFYALIARFRVDEFCKMASKGMVDNINEAFFTVGFRSRSTAYERFKEQTGVTPAEYIKAIKTGEA